jgi:DNA polymerase-3 subunit gamma/tau
MFENILGQAAAAQIRQDAEAGLLAPSMLFWGPPAAGKGSAALELARFLSCEQPPPDRGRWNCSCAACALHRFLAHPDLLVLGSRSFSAEIAAARDCLLREKDGAAAPVLFFRALRKLGSRFSPVLWEDDPKLGKLAPLLSAIEEDTEDLDRLLRARKKAGGPADDGEFEKNLDRLSARLVQNTCKLEAEGMGESIPIAQIRRAAAWSHLAPAGRGKFILIENADRMQEGARNSLLKILEEPPSALTVVLTTARREAILPTLLSRLRPYRFMKRDAAAEEEVIRRIFRASPGPSCPPVEGGNRITAWLDTFLPVSPASFRPLAAFFIASLTKRAVIAARKGGRGDIPAALLRLGMYCGPIASEGGLGLSADSREVVSTVLSGTGAFSPRSLFSRFAGIVLSLISESLARGKGAAPEAGGAAAADSPSMILYNDIWRVCTGEAVQAMLVWNQNPALTLDRLANVLVSSMAAAAIREGVQGAAG